MRQAVQCRQEEDFLPTTTRPGVCGAWCGKGVCAVCKMCVKGKACVQVAQGSLSVKRGKEEDRR